MEIPKAIIDAVNALLAPYGEHYEQGSPVQTRPSEGYLPPKRAALFLGVSTTYLYRLVKSGKLHPKKFGTSKNSKVVYDRAELTSLIQTL